MTDPSGPRVDSVVRLLCRGLVPCVLGDLGEGGNGEEGGREGGGEQRRKRGKKRKKKRVKTQGKFVFIKDLKSLLSSDHQQVVCRHKL